MLTKRIEKFRVKIINSLNNGRYIWEKQIDDDDFHGL